MRPLSIVVISKSQAAVGTTKPTLVMQNAQFRQIMAQQMVTFMLNLPKPVTDFFFFFFVLLKFLIINRYVYLEQIYMNVSHLSARRPSGPFPRPCTFLKPTEEIEYCSFEISLVRNFDIVTRLRRRYIYHHLIPYFTNG